MEDNLPIKKLGIIGVLVITFLLHLTYIPNEFTWIDHQDVERQWAVFPLAELYKAFISPLGLSNFYRPLIVISYSLDAAIYQQWVPGYHLTNVLLQLGVVIAAILTAKRVFNFDDEMSLLVGLLVGLHPLNWLPVGAIAYRQELLAVAFSWLALMFYADGRANGKTKPLVLALGSFLLALWSKETALFWVPGIIIVWGILLSKKETGITDYKKKMLFGGIAIAVVYLLMRTYALSSIWKLNYVSMTISEHLGTRIMVFGNRLLELVSPFKPALSDATRIVEITDPIVVFVSLVIIGLLLALAYFWKKNPRVAALLAMLLIGLLPALNTIPLPRFSSPHYSYFSMPAAVMLIVLGYEYLKKNLHQEFVANGLIGIVLLIMAITTFQSGFQFKDDLSLFLPEIADDQYFREAQYYVGTYYFRNGNLQGASFYLEEALKQTPGIIANVDRSAAQINLAGVRLVQGRLDEAEILLRQAEYPETPLQIPYNLALIAKERKDYARVIALLENLDPSVHEPESILLLAQAYLMVGEQEKADELLARYFPEFDVKQREIIKQQLQSEANG